MTLPTYSIKNMQVFYPLSNGSIPYFETPILFTKNKDIGWGTVNFSQVRQSFKPFKQTRYLNF